MHFLLLFHLFYHNQASKYKSALYKGCLYKRGENIYESQMLWIRAQIYLYYLEKKATQGFNAYSKNDSSWYLGNILGLRNYECITCGKSFKESSHLKSYIIHIHKK